MIRTAILVDGGYYRRKVVHFSGNEDAITAANRLYGYCMKHAGHDRDESHLYRVLYYDCFPSDKKVFHPLKKGTVDLKNKPLYRWTVEFFDQLKRKRKLALRLGKLSEEQAAYSLTREATKDLFSGKKKLDEISEKDFCISIKQKGVDTRIGIDIVAMSLKKQVDKIVLITGDSDFVPAAKFARREGIDFVLDSMGASIKPELSEHIDGLNFFPDFLCNPMRSAPH